MPLLKSSIKANNQNIKRRKRNTSFKKGLKTILKLILDSVDKGDLKTAEANMSEAYSQIDKAIKKNILEKNTGARRKKLLHNTLRKAGSKVSKFEKLVKEPVKKKSTVKKAATTTKKTIAKKTTTKKATVKKTK